MLAQAEHQHQQMMVIKGKRTKRHRPASPLITMSTSSSGLDDTCSARLTASSSTTTNVESSLNTATATTQEEEDMAYCLILLAQGGGTNPSQQHQSSAAVVYECKTCSRCFPSFQALGGHRASHKKPKTTSPPEPEHRQSPDPNRLTAIPGVGLSLQMACNSSNTLTAINFNPNDNPTKSKVHACGICGVEFSSGQALGGHMRRHRPLVTGGGSAPATQEPPRNLQMCLDLNLPAEEEAQDPETPKFLFGSNENTLVFTAGSLVDCRY